MTLRDILRSRILFFDGAMGTMLQRHTFSEEDFRGARFAQWAQPVKGNNDLLSITQADAVRAVHTAYLEAGANIISTNTFSSTRIAQADYGMEDLAYEMNVDGARRAREAIDAFVAKNPDHIALVGGAIGPTNRTLSLSPDVNDPGFRAVTFDAVKEGYKEAARGLIEGGADIIMIETIFDTLNAKAGIVACRELFRELGQEKPIILSGTITDKSGRTLSGQTPTAFWHSVRHANPLAVGLNCALGAKDMRAHLKELSDVADTFISAYPNAGLPNAFGEYDESPEDMAADIRAFAEDGLINIVGGCCGSTPEHIAAMVEAVKDLPPRVVPDFNDTSENSEVA